MENFALMNALSLLRKKDIKQIFLSEIDNTKCGAYIVKLYVEKLPVHVIVDDYFPI